MYHANVDDATTGSRLSLLVHSPALSIKKNAPWLRHHGNESIALDFATIASAKRFIRYWMREYVDQGGLPGRHNPSYNDPYKPHIRLEWIGIEDIPV